ncbi:hypothetical protein [Synechococcus sp. Cu2B8-bc1011]
MTKDDWIKLAMPASITLLAMAILSVPLLSNAQLTQTGEQWNPVYVKVLD